MNRFRILIELNNNIPKITAKLLLEINAVHFNSNKPFTLTSGLKSPVYIDCRKLISYPKARHTLIKFFTEINKKIFELIIKKMRSSEQITIRDLELDNQLMEKITKFAPIKHILKNKSIDDQKIIELLEDISRDLTNYDLEFRIQELESKFSMDMSETTFNKLKELKKEQNSN